MRVVVFTMNHHITSLAMVG